MAISTAVGSERISRVVGYQVKAANFRDSTPNLPQAIIVLGEANAANQASLSLNRKEVNSAKEAGELYGYGSPIYTMMRILRPVNGNGIVGGIPTIVIPQEEVAGAVASVSTITVTGTVTSNGSHAVNLMGRTNLDGASYSFTVVTTDTVTTIAAKIADAINASIGSPVIATSALGVVTLTAKWKGLTSNQITATIDTGDDTLGVSYASAQTVAGAGTQTVTTSLVKIGNSWDTILINPYGADVFSELETYNGTPDASTPSGRYASTVFKPLIALFGGTQSTVSAVTTITNVSARRDQVTQVYCPAPNSEGFDFEASANVASLVARTFQDTPHLSINAMSYSDMPVPSDGDIGDFAVYNNRDSMVKKGASTVDLVNGKYVVQDLVTTYAPTGEPNPSWRYVRSLMQDFNVKFGYYLLEEINVRDHAIAASDQVTTVTKVVKPKQWIQILNSYFKNLASRALIVEPDFSSESLQVGVSEDNPDRLETSFRYKRSGIARVASTTAEAGFAFGVR